MNSFMPRIAADIEALDYQMEDKTVAQLRTWQSVLRKAGSKSRPTIVNGLGQYHNDGWPLEWAFEPAESVQQFLEHDIGMRQLIEQRFDVQLTGYDYFSIDDSILTHRDNGLGYMYSVGRQLGCSPDYVEWDVPRRIPRWVKMSKYREMGLHLHFDLRPDVVGTPKVQDFIDQLDEDMRPFHVQAGGGDYRPWYRMAGVYRPKAYGVEYRSLGSSILNDAGTYATMLRVAFNRLDKHWGES